jgi:hypothetical protein
VLAECRFRRYRRSILHAGNLLLNHIVVNINCPVYVLLCVFLIMRTVKRR